MRRRAWIYVLSVAALLGPAAGIAYLGAVSYRDERGAVAARIEQQRMAAVSVTERLQHRIAEALDQADLATAIHTGDGRAGVAAPLAQHWFWIGSDKQLREPRPAPTAPPPTRPVLVTTGCEKMLATECTREQRIRRTRVAALQAGERAEAAAQWPEAKKQYALAAVAGAHTQMEALLGLARVCARQGDAAAAEQALAELERGHRERIVEGVPLTLVVATLRARSGEALLHIAERILDGGYAIDPFVRLGVVARLRRDLGAAAVPLPAEHAARLGRLDDRVAAIKMEARRAAGLADEVAEIARNATAEWQGRPATREPARTVIYRRRADGGAIGLTVDTTMLEQAIASEELSALGLDLAGDVARRVRALVLPAGVEPDRAWRLIVQVPLGAALPHLNLALVNPAADPDPLDEVIRERSRRHVIYTSALAVALGLGLLALIRGAARARELARLKSDFVSTVSHELKTPLTSIRMFAEMLEQGVAQGDAAKMARYHGVIVQESQRLGLLIANLLDYAQIERGTRRYTTTRHELAQLARQAVTTFETLRSPDSSDDATERNPISVAVSPEAMHVEVDVDRDVVVQALLNLVSNAVKYGGTRSTDALGSPIEVSVGADATHAWVAVRDYGPGIPAGEQARIFREFYRAPEAYRAGVEGTGLGLALVKRHVESLGGTVDVESEVGRGATFTIRLPRAAASHVEEELP